MNAAVSRLLEAPMAFSLMTGGPFHTLARRLHLTTPDGVPRVFRLAMCMWIPVAAGTVYRFFEGLTIDPLVYDISVHARILVSLPLLALASKLVEVQVRVVFDQLYSGSFVPTDALERISQRAAKLRDNGWVELVIAIVALAGGIATIVGIAGASGFVHGGTGGSDTVMRYYYAGLVLPLLQFLAVRWMWRWIVWIYIVIALSKHPLKMLATHPDRAAGLGFMGAPLTGFAAYELALSSLLAAAWGTQLLDGRITIPAAVPTLLLFMVIVFIVACGPLVFLSPHLYTAQRQALAMYSPLALEYMRQFHRKWIDRRAAFDEPLIGSSDIQSMADMGNAFGVIQQTRMFIFNKRKLAELWLAAVVPMAPLVATVVPVTEMFKRLGSMLVGGILI